MDRYEVVAPIGLSASVAISATRRLESLSGCRVAFVWDEVFRGDEMFAILESELGQTSTDLTFVAYEHFGTPEGPNGPAMVAALPRLLEAHRVDAVIAGVGA